MKGTFFKGSSWWRFLNARYKNKKSVGVWRGLHYTWLYLGKGFRNNMASSWNRICGERGGKKERVSKGWFVGWPNARGYMIPSGIALSKSCASKEKRCNDLNKLRVLLKEPWRRKCSRHVVLPRRQWRLWFPRCRSEWNHPGSGRPAPPPSTPPQKCLQPLCAPGAGCDVKLN